VRHNHSCQGKKEAGVAPKKKRGGHSIDDTTRGVLGTRPQEEIASHIAYQKEMKKGGKASTDSGPSQEKSTAEGSLYS